MAGPHHRTPAYVHASRRLVAAAYANPATRCGRCGRTLAEHAPHLSGKPATWHAGHINDGQLNGPLRAEASTCNIAAGNQRRRRGQRWSPPTPPPDHHGE